MKLDQMKLIVEAVAAGKTIQRRGVATDIWFDINPLNTSMEFNNSGVYRVKPVEILTAQYKRYVFRLNGTDAPQVALVRTQREVETTPGWTAFVKWIDTEWQRESVEMTS